MRFTYLIELKKHPHEICVSFSELPNFCEQQFCVEGPTLAIVASFRGIGIEEHVAPLGGTNVLALGLLVKMGKEVLVGS